MAAGDQLARRVSRPDVIVRTETGVVVEFDPPSGPLDTPQILSHGQRRGLDDAIADAEHATGLRFATFLGDLGPDPRSRAEELLASLGADAPYGALIALSPGQRRAEIVTGTEAALRISDRSARSALLSATAACKDGDLPGALINAVRILADHAGPIPRASSW